MPELLDLQRRHIRLKSPLGEGGRDTLYFLTMVKTEKLGRLFVMDLDCISNDHHITLKDVLGKPMTIELDLPERSDEMRYFHGLVSEFSYLGHFEGFAHYKAKLMPWPWFLSRKQDSRIFQEMTVPEIIEQVFKEINGFNDFKRVLNRTYRTRVYTVQYRETDFNFVSRLMEEEGIYYYFEHESDKHVLVLSDDYSSHGPFPGYDELLYFPAETEFRRKDDHIWKWNICEGAQSGKIVLDDFDFVKPSADLETRSAGSGGYAQSDKEVFDYPGLYTEVADGEDYARIRMEEHGALQEQLQGEGNARGLAVGHLFNLNEEAAPDWRDEQNREYLITSATHILRLEESEEQEDSYECRFTAIDARVPFRPQRITPKPTVRGIQTAIVCGKEGEEIWTDKYGRIKVQFHWDRQGENDENSSCWIRVAQLWAGKNWGAMFIPRIGQEVVVDFLEGDPDRPLIIGRVYNDELMPPYELPAEMTKSTIKSRSTKGGTPDNFNELRFEDKIGEEEIYFHAEKDFNRVVENNDTLKVGYDDKDKGDQTIGINHDRTTTIGNDDTLNVGYEGDKEAGSQTVKIFKDRTTTLETGNDTLNVSAGKRYVEAAQEIQLVVGTSKIVMKPAEITIQAVKITIKADAQLSLQGSISELKGDATLTLKGGVIMIN
ncbi:MAG: type VI secretion system tip protein VgrG [Proteobacteria bacterium]|nr:type VI secretion system tip protein VgrG [Pseudomonadota bacterium]MCH8997030.1 type VI secretion system tip protein VgrG [Pseudomonadota bacterium]